MLPGAKIVSRVGGYGGFPFTALGFAEWLSTDESEKLFDILETHYGDVIPHRDSYRFISFKKRNRTRESDSQS